MSQRSIPERPGDVRGSRDDGLGPLSTTALVAASMIGAGVFTTSGYLIADLGSPAWVLLAWLVGGGVALCGALTYAGLATRFTESGGEYVLLARAVHPVAGLMAGWVSLLAGFTGAIAFAAQACASYLAPLLEPWFGALSPRWLAISLVVLCVILNWIHTAVADRAQRWVVALKLLLIAGLAVVAVGQFPEAWVGYSQPVETGPPGALGFATALMWVSLSYCGFNAAIYMAGEVRDPQRNVPRGIVGGAALVTVVYLVLNAIFVLVPPIDAIAGKEDVAASAAASLGGPAFVTLVRVIIVLSLTSSVLAMTMTGPRVYAKMAEDGFLPARLSDRGRPTRATLVLQGLLAIATIWIATLQTLLSYLGFTLAVSAALTCCLVFLPSQREVTERIPLYPLPPLLFVGGTAITATLAAVRRPEEAKAAAATILLGALIYGIQHHLGRRSPR